MSFEPKFALLIAATTIITYFSGLFIRWADKTKSGKYAAFSKKLWVFISFASNLGILFFYKYYNFFDTSVSKLFSWFDISISMPVLKVVLPVGISFYTLQALSYTIDVYRKDIKAEVNIVKYALFVSFFPQLASGPIEKSKNMLKQYSEKHNFDYFRVKNGLVLIMWGFFQKLFIADRLGILVNTVFNAPQNYKGFQIVLAVFFFAFQLYCDFGAYSDIAVGAGQVLGYDLTRNFKQPYLARSIKEFWRRWHISLTSWFRDYLYFPLGGNRCSKARNYFNIMIVFLVSGLWHGAAVNFIIWGALHGSYQLLGNLLKPVKERIIKILRIDTDVFSFKLFQVICTFCLVDFAWLFFRANSFSDAKILIKNMMYFNPWIFTDGSIYSLGLDQKDLAMAVAGILIMIVTDVLRRTKSLRFELSMQNTVFRWSVYIAVIVLILIFGIYGPGYDKQQFIYNQF
jgi:D-alanyl-lipoteichoic acid acyltransferase DltB (MBOAT superfamily)